MKLAAAEKAVATLAPMVAVLAVELAALCSGESKTGASKVGAGARGGRARQRAFQGQSQAARAPRRRGAAERAREAAAAAVPPCAKDVLRCPLLPQPARCERLERDRSAHAIGTKSVRVATSSPVCSMHPVGEHKRLRGTKMRRPSHRRSGRRGGRQRLLYVGHGGLHKGGDTLGPRSASLSPLVKAVCVCVACYLREIKYGLTPFLSEGGVCCVHAL